MRKKLQLFDIIVLSLLTIWMLIILFPFINVVAISFTSNKEYLENPLLLFPSQPTLKNYEDLFQDGRILSGYKNTSLILLMALPLNLFLTLSFSYALSRNGYPGRKLIFYMVLFTMLFNGGIIPMYMLMMELRLTGKLLSVVLASGLNTFYIIIARNFFATLPAELFESAVVDGAGEWKMLFKIALPLSAPIVATVTLFYAVDRWNEWFNAMIFIRKTSMQPLQVVLRSMVLDSQVFDKMAATAAAAVEQERFSNGIKMAAVMVTMVPIMCVFPFLQKYFVKGVLVGAIKA